MEAPEQVMELLLTGNSRRNVAATAMNNDSSRSHSIFRIVVESKVFLFVSYILMTGN